MLRAMLVYRNRPLSSEIYISEPENLKQDCTYHGKPEPSHEGVVVRVPGVASTWRAHGT